MKKPLFIAVLFIFTSFFGCGFADSKTEINKKTVMIPTRDGKELACDLYFPPMSIPIQRRRPSLVC